MLRRFLLLGALIASILSAALVGTATPAHAAGSCSSINTGVPNVDNGAVWSGGINGAKCSVRFTVRAYFQYYDGTQWRTVGSSLGSRYGNGVACTADPGNASILGASQCYNTTDTNSAGNLLGYTGAGNTLSYTITEIDLDPAFGGACQWKWRQMTRVWDWTNGVKIADYPGPATSSSPC